jgi:molybdenum cofactor cytidylyltransferase
MARLQPWRVTKAHVAVVLAAGGSARLAQPKQLLMRDGETLIHRTVHLALETRPERVFVVLGADAERIERAIDGMPCEIIHNASWKDGLASSLRAVAPVVSDSASTVLVLGCDQPALEVEHLRALLDGAAISAAGVAATLHEGLAGIPAVVPSQWFGDVHLQGDRGFGESLRALSTGSAFLLQAPELHLDIDTPDDLRAARNLGLIDPA